MGILFLGRENHGKPSCKRTVRFISDHGRTGVKISNFFETKSSDDGKRESEEEGLCTRGVYEKTH